MSPDTFEESNQWFYILLPSLDAMLRDMANAAAMEIPLSQGLRPKFLLYKREGPENILNIKNFWMVNSSS